MRENEGGETDRTTRAQPLAHFIEGNADHTVVLKRRHLAKPPLGHEVDRPERHNGMQRGDW